MAESSDSIHPIAHLSSNSAFPIKQQHQELNVLIGCQAPFPPSPAAPTIADELSRYCRRFRLPGASIAGGLFEIGMRGGPLHSHEGPRHNIWLDLICIASHGRSVLASIFASSKTVSTVGRNLAVGWMGVCEHPRLGSSSLLEEGRAMARLRSARSSSYAARRSGVPRYRLLGLRVVRSGRAQAAAA